MIGQSSRLFSLLYGALLPSLLAIRDSGKWKANCGKVMINPKYFAPLSSTCALGQQRKEAAERICVACFGYGFWPGEDVAVTDADAMDGFYAEPCHSCGADNSYYEQVAEDDGAISMNAILDIVKNSINFDGVLDKFERGMKCAESSDILGANAQP